MEELQIVAWKDNIDLRTVSARTDKLRALLKRWRIGAGQAALVTNGGLTRVRLVFRTGDNVAGVVWYEADETRKVLGELFKASVTHILNGWPHKASLSVPLALVNRRQAQLRQVA
jgi:hypothetical protein